MTGPDHDVPSVRAMLARMHGADPGELLLERRLIRGGLEAASVSRLSVRYRDARGKRQVRTMIVKHLVGSATREVGVYRALLSTLPALTPRLLAADERRAGEAVLFLEALRPVSRWPWRDTAAAGSVLGQVALLHQCIRSKNALSRLSAWDYEADLLASAERTLEQLQRLRGVAPVFRSGARWARRMVAALPALRRHLLGFGPFGTTLIHGDLHSGNVIMRRRAGRNEPVLLDWARSRIGSPLEDVSSWLQSLGAWEPEARRRHDTLFAGYLAARGMEPRLGRDLRAAYWLAGASNALAGALFHHLRVLAEPCGSRTLEWASGRAAQDWLRVLRRADACWN